MKLESQNSVSDGLAPKFLTFPTVSSPALPLRARHVFVDATN